MVLAVQDGVGVAVVFAKVLVGPGEHAARPAGGVVDGLHHVAAPEVRLRREEQADHQPDDLAGREVLSRLLVRLLGADPDQLLEDVAHLDVVDAVWRQVHSGEPLDDLEQQVLLVHACDLLAEGATLHDLAHVGGEVADVGAEVLCQVVRVVEQPLEVEPGRVVERPARRLLKEALAHVLVPAGIPGVGVKHRLLRLLQHAVEAPQDGQGEDDLAVLVSLVRASQQVADAPDEVR